MRRSPRQISGSWVNTAGLAAAKAANAELLWVLDDGACLLYAIMERHVYGNEEKRREHSARMRGLIWAAIKQKYSAATLERKQLILLSHSTDLQDKRIAQRRHVKEWLV